MKKHLVLIAFTLAGAMAFAQEKERGHRRHDITEEMKKELSLSDDQYQRIKAIHESYRAKMHDLRIDSVKSRDDKREAMKSLIDVRRKEVDGVLTPDQRATWESRTTARNEKHRAHSQKVAADRMLKLKTELSLTDRQFEKFQAANKTFRDKASKLKEGALNEEQKKAEFRKLREEHEKSIKSILNKDQYKKWSEMKKKRGAGHHGADKRRG